MRTFEYNARCYVIPHIQLVWIDDADPRKVCMQTVSGLINIINFDSATIAKANFVKIVDVVRSWRGAE